MKDFIKIAKVMKDKVENAVFTNTDLVDILPPKFEFPKNRKNGLLDSMAGGEYQFFKK